MSCRNFTIAVKGFSGPATSFKLEDGWPRLWNRAIERAPREEMQYFDCTGIQFYSLNSPTVYEQVIEKLTSSKVR